MFVMAKLFIALGLRDDLAVIIGPIPQQTPSSDTLYAADRTGRAAHAFMMRALVTGGSGFIGQHLVSELVARGRQVRVLDVRLPTRAASVVDYVQGSVLDSGLVHDVIGGVDEVYHLAGLPGMWKLDRSDFYDVNFRGTENILAAARRRGVARFLHCSTESILFRASRPSGCRRNAEDALLNADDMPGPLYTFENAR